VQRSGLVRRVRVRMRVRVRVRSDRSRGRGQAVDLSFLLGRRQVAIGRVARRGDRGRLSRRVRMGMGLRKVVLVRLASVRCRGVVERRTLVGAHPRRGAWARTCL
jgi:hypothetical protein